MNNEQQLYILRRGANVQEDDLIVRHHSENSLLNASGVRFDKVFNPVDVSGLTRQVEELLDGDYRSYSDYLDWCDMPPKEKRIKLHSTAEQIVLLLLNQEGETK